MNNILTLLCILCFAPAAFAGGTTLFTTPQNAAGQNNWFQDGAGNSYYYTQVGYDSVTPVRNNAQPAIRTVTKENNYERSYQFGGASTYRTKQDKYYNHGGVKFGTGFLNNGAAGRLY